MQVNVTPDSVRSARTLASRARRKTAYFEARKAGHSQREAARIAGCNPITGCRWEQQQKAIESGHAAALEAPLKREELAALLAKSLKKAAEGQIQYVAPLAAQYSALQGLAQPVRAQLDVRHLFPGVQQWLQSLPADSNDDAIDVTPQEQLETRAQSQSPESDNVRYVNQSITGAAGEGAPPEPPK